MILKTPALVHVFSLDEPTPAISQWACEGKLKLSRRVVAAQDIGEASIVYAAQMNTLADDRVVALAQRHGVWLTRWTGRLIQTSLPQRSLIVPRWWWQLVRGSGPVLARWLKAKIEALLPSNLGAVANFARRNRNLAKQVPVGKARRTFWQSLFKSLLDSPALINQSKEALDAHLSTILDQSVSQSSGFGRVDFVGAGPGDADLITVKGSRVLHDADVIVHDRLVGQGVLDLARREALIIDVGKKDLAQQLARKKLIRLSWLTPKMKASSGSKEAIHPYSAGWMRKSMLVESTEFTGKSSLESQPHPQLALR